MSSKVYQGDEWKHAEGPGPRGLSRRERQAQLDTAYGLRIITLKEWREKTDELSNPEIWTAEGKIA